MRCWGEGACPLVLATVFVIFAAAVAESLFVLPPDFICFLEPTLGTTITLVTEGGVALSWFASVFVAVVVVVNFVVVKGTAVTLDDATLGVGWLWVEK